MCLVPETTKASKRNTMNSGSSDNSLLSMGRNTFMPQSLSGEKSPESSTSRSSFRPTDSSQSGSVLAEIAELTTHLYQITLEEEDEDWDDDANSSVSDENAVTSSTAGSVVSRHSVNHLAAGSGRGKGAWNGVIGRGDLLNIVFGFKSREDQESWAKALSIATVTETERRAKEDRDGMATSVRPKRQSGPMTRAFKKLMWQLLYMIPDNLELQHRYIASQARVSEDTEVIESSRGLNTLPSCICIKVISARGLPIKESRLKGINHTAEYQSTVFVQLQMKKSLSVVAKFRTIGQPKAQNPAFREEFEFNNIEFGDTSYIQIDMAVKNSSLSLGEAESKIGVITLKMNILSKAPYTSVAGYKDWFPLSNAKTGAPIAAGDAALQLSIHAY